jgi:hypothetical protein
MFVIDESERVCGEAVCLYFEVLSPELTEGKPRETSIKTPGLRCSNPGPPETESAVLITISEHLLWS